MTQPFLQRLPAMAVWAAISFDKALEYGKDEDHNWEMALQI